MNIPVLVIGIFAVLVGLVVVLRLAVSVDYFRKNADRKGLPRGIFTTGTVLIGALTFCVFGIYFIVVGSGG